ncbi:MAG: glycine dehydrogenase (aminomethyl-transferring), partial [Caldilineaceae bacterium]|nr:glycine dehydrogenase (aminomethyl-transferring) [Caldilineaceae bacterium]
MIDKQMLLARQDQFVHRHLGPDDLDIERMVEVIGVDSLDALINETVPKAIRMDGSLKLAGPRSESAVLDEMRALAKQNQLYRSFIGMGYYGCLTPPVILRNILENPGWYTQYTPYQAEIAQGRLEALLNFQTMVSDLTGLEIANASLLDESSAAAEAMLFARKVGKSKSDRFLVSDRCHPQTLAVLQTRAEPMGIDLVIGEVTADAAGEAFGVLVQYPDTHGRIDDWRTVAEAVQATGGLAIAATDLLALTLLTPPGEWGADIAIGSAQRFGVPMGFGGPHAAFLACADAHKRSMPGRLVGVSIDAQGRQALRLALQTREQHIRREKAT